MHPRSAITSPARASSGAAGDFVTGPELTPLYGGALARQIEGVLGVTRGREIVELGAGSGALAASMLNALALRGASADPVSDSRGEPGALREQQRATITALAHDELARVEWLDRLPAAIDGVVVMNEVLDAVPPEIVARRSGAWFLRGVTWSDGAFAWSERPLDDARVRALAEARYPAEGDYTSEVNPAAEALVMTTCPKDRIGRAADRRLRLSPSRVLPRATQRGNPRRTLPTSRACRSVSWPGLSDLTAHVDFTAMAHAAGAGRDARRGIRDAGVVPAGLRHPRPAGRGRRARHCRTYLRAAAAVQQLLSPAEMGELFKVLLLARGDGDWPALAVSDMAHRL